MTGGTNPEIIRKQKREGDCNELRQRFEIRLRPRCFDRFVRFARLAEFALDQRLPNIKRPANAPRAVGVRSSSASASDWAGAIQVLVKTEARVSVSLTVR